MADSLKWTITPIAGSTLRTTPDPPQGDTIWFRYENLPSQNNQFGGKYITAKLVEQNVVDSVMVKAFFPKCVFNSPMDTVPNWFYYWREGAVVPGFLFDIYYARNDTSRALGFTRFSQIYFTSKADSIIFPDTGGTVGNYHFDQARGMHCTAFVVGHERFHEWIYDQWSSGNWGSQFENDPDLDGLPNWFERDSSLTDSTNQDTFGIYETFGWDPLPGIGDQEYWACVGGKFNPKGDTLKDWSHGRFSKQWSGP